MQGVLTRFLLSLVFVAWAVSAEAASPTSEIKGLWLVTDFPSVAARTGETAIFKIKLQNQNLPPEQVALSVVGLPSGWKSQFLGGGRPIGAAMAMTDQSVELELHVDVPAEAPSETLAFTVEAKGAQQKTELPIHLMMTGDLPAKLSLKTKLPSLKGTPKSNYEYNFTVTNESGKTLLVNLAADAPSGFQTTFTEAYGTQELTSIPVDAGQNKDMKVKVTPPSTVSAGSYDLAVHVSADGASADAPLKMDVTGQPKLRLTTPDGRLSGSAEAGNSTPITLQVTNDGSAPASNLEFSASPPTDWKIEFDPKTIPSLDAGKSREVQAMVIPASKAIAGDYMTTFRANAKEDSTSADYRVAVTTSTMWGIIAVAIIAIALLVLLGAVARFGRR
jgi:uncharacterized membrane protein